MPSPRHYYRVWCTTDSKWEYIWDTVVPTTCPANGAHTIDASKITIEETRQPKPFNLSLPKDTEGTGASKENSKGYATIKVTSGSTAYGLSSLVWGEDKHTDAKLVLQVAFWMSASGTGTVVRICGQIKKTADGEDSGAAFTLKGFQSITINYTRVGDRFSTEIELDASSFEKGDSISIQAGRDGNNDYTGGGASDNASVAINIQTVEALAI